MRSVAIEIEIFTLPWQKKMWHLWLLVSFLAASSHHVWTTKRKWLQAIDITLDTHKITVLLQFFWVVLPRYECRVGKMSKLCQNVTPVMKSRGTFFSCINNLCFLHHTMPPLDQQIYLNHFKTPNSLAGLKQSMLAWSFRSGVSKSQEGSFQIWEHFISFLYTWGKAIFPERCYVGDISKLCWIWHLGDLGKWQPSACNVISSLWLCDDVLAWSRRHFPGRTSPHPSLSKSGVQKLGRELYRHVFFFFEKSLHIMLFIRWIEDEHR